MRKEMGCHSDAYGAAFTVEHFVRHKGWGTEGIRFELPGSPSVGDDVLEYAKGCVSFVVHEGHPLGEVMTLSLPGYWLLDEMLGEIGLWAEPVNNWCTAVYKIDDSEGEK